jgi:putative oxidoreductase
MILGRLEKARSFAPLLLRLVVGAVGIYHGHGKLFGGMDRFVETVEGLHLPAPLLLAWVAALSEFVGGIFLVLGLMTRWAALFFAVTMGVAVFRVHWNDGFKGYEFPLVLLVAAVSLVFTGGGWLSFDRHVVRSEF